MIFFIIAILILIECLFHSKKVEIDAEKIRLRGLRGVIMECNIKDIEYISIENFLKATNVYVHSEKIKRLKKQRIKKGRENIIKFQFRDDSISMLRRLYSGHIEDRSQQ